MSKPDFLKKTSEIERLCQRVDEAGDENDALAALNTLSAYLTSAYLTNHSDGAGPAALPEPTLAVFRGIPGSGEVCWVAAVEGLSNARGRMEAAAAEKPGPYFVFCAQDHSCLATIDTTARTDKESGAV